MNTNMLVHYVIKRIWIVILIGIVFAIGLAFEKNNIDEYAVKNGEFFYSKVVKIDNYESFTKNGLIKDEFQLETYAKMYRLSEKFYNESKFQFDKLCSDWNKYTILEKNIWIKNHFFINSIGAGMYEIAFFESDKDAKDYNYVKSNGANVLDAYILMLEGEIQHFNNQAKFIQMEKYNIVPKEAKIEKKNIVIKYATIGFLLGAMFAITVLLINCKMRNKNGK